MATFVQLLAAGGPVRDATPIPSANLRKFHGRLPEELIELLAETGAGGFFQGLFWTVDPHEEHNFLAEWLDNAESAAPFLRSAFGDIFFWHGDGSYRLSVHYGKTTPVLKTAPLYDKFLVDAKILDKVFRRELFAKATKKLGPIDADAMFTFEPALMLGGAEMLKHVRRVARPEQLAMLAGMRAE